MKAKKIKKIRKKIGSLKKFAIQDTESLFGNFDETDFNRYKEIKAGNIKRALKIYYKWYFNYYKEKHEIEGVFTETKRRFGHIMIVNEKGQKFFYGY